MWLVYFFVHFDALKIKVLDNSFYFILVHLCPSLVATKAVSVVSGS